MASVDYVPKLDKRRKIKKKRTNHLRECIGVSELVVPVNSKTIMVGGVEQAS